MIAMPKRTDEITAVNAAKRLHIDRRNILRMIKRGELNARLVTDVPRPFYLISVDDKFLAEEKTRDQAKSA